MPLSSTFPDVMWTVFAGSEGVPLFSANHSSEEEAIAMLETLQVRHPTTSFGISQYRRVDGDKTAAVGVVVACSGGK